MAKQWMPIIQRLHFQINLMLWSGLVAFLIVFGLFFAPNIRANQAAWQITRAAEISSENDVYCRRWNFTPSTDEYRSCLDDLHGLRNSIEKRSAEDMDF
jgi:hypothetical protein